MKNEYYVYEWIRLDTNEPFYIGKGKSDRCYKLTREKNKHFNNIVKSIPVAVNILHDSLDEQVAYDLECYYIWLYRDEIGYDLCNMTDGGEGVTLCGKNNPNYGKGYLIMGENNPNYGNGDKIRGKNNPMYGKDSWGHMTKEQRIERSKKQSEKISGENHPKAKPIICLTTGKIFSTITEASKYYNTHGTAITKCCKGKLKSSGKLDGVPLKWMYLDDYVQNGGETNE